MCEFYKNGYCKFRKKDGLCGKYISREDNLSLRCVGLWSKEKIEFFKYYADMFVTGMKKKWKKRYYIDLFTGPGKCIIREDLGEINSSCLEIINLRDKFTNYFFVDKSQTCIKDLRKRAGSVKNIIFYNEDCNLVIKEIIKTIPENSLSLAIIDPDSLQFHFNNYAELSKRKIDLIIYYPIGPIERAVSSVYKQKLKSKILDKFHPGWKDIISKRGWGNSKSENIKSLIKDYKRKIEKLDYFSSDITPPFKNKKNTTLYYLFAFSKSKKGILFWKKATQGIAKRGGQQALIFDIVN